MRHTFAIAIALIAMACIFGTASAATQTTVTGTLGSIFSFNAPSDASFSVLDPSLTQPETATSATGMSVTSNGPNGWTVQVKGLVGSNNVPSGQMKSTDSLNHVITLASPLKISVDSYASNPITLSGTNQNCMTGTQEALTTYSAAYSQAVAWTDTPSANAYSLTLVFTAGNN